MKILLVVMLLNGEGFALPMVSMDACIQAEEGLDITEVKWSRCAEEH